MSSLKSGKDKEILPIYKALAPLLSLHPAVHKIHTQSISKHIQLNTPDLVSDKDGKRKKPLAVILSWMLAKETHLEKYRSLYLNKGFDVLTVHIAPKDLLFPVSGSQAVATSLLEYLRKHDGYEDVLFHAFSVGGYMMGEMFIKIRDNGDTYKSIPTRIKGVILDSAVDFEGIPTGFPRAVSRNPITVRVLEWYIATHLAVMYNVATKHYLRSSKNFHNTPLRCPALFFTSEADKVGSPSQNQLVMENWEVRGCDVTFKCFKDSKHVSHMYKHTDEYIAEVDKFLQKINLVPDKQ